METYMRSISLTPMKITNVIAVMALAEVFLNMTEYKLIYIVKDFDIKKQNWT
jgi:hypothetical protein